jgi:very-short-patch-repair endonuclease
MTPRHPELPESLLGAYFTPSQALARGVDGERLRGDDIERRVHGVRGPKGAFDELSSRCRLFAARLGPDVFFSHVTAARLLGVPLPTHLERLVDVDVTVSAPARAPHAEGLRGHSRRVLPGDVIELRGIRVSSPTRVFFELARVLGRTQLVAVADHVTHERRGWCTLDDLGRRARQTDRLAASRKALEALALADSRAESPPETALRVMLTVAGLPPSGVNHPVVALGRRYRIDLAYVAEKVAVEFQGEYHFTPEQGRADMSRRSALEAEGWIVVELNIRDLDDPRAVVARVRAALARASHR